MNRLSYGFSSHWMALFSLLYGAFVGLPFLAPVFMAEGLTTPGKIIYGIYSFLCHQLPERSLFFFGPRIMVPLADITAGWKFTHNPLLLRQFVGSPELGWKVAWSDRMVYMFTSVLIFAWVWWLLRKWLRPITWRGLLAFLLPMLLDGATHMVSDLGGLHQGFRDSNAWLASLTGGAFSPAFYAGDAWGSFNAVMRLVSGILFGAGVVWFAFPYLDEYFKEQSAWIREKFERAGRVL